MQKRYFEAKELLENTFEEIESQKTKMHAEFVLAQIEKALGNIERAKFLINFALIKAEKLGATRDAKRFRDFNKSL